MKSLESCPKHITQVCRSYGAHRIPLIEGFNHFLISEAADSAQNVVGLADKLHVPVLNAVVHHFHKVARAAWAHVCDAWAIIDLQSQAYQHMTAIIKQWPAASMPASAARELSSAAAFTGHDSQL